MLKLTLISLFLAFTSTWNLVQAGQVYIPVGEARIKKSVLAFSPTKYLGAGFDSGDSKSTARTIRETVLADLTLTNLFTIQNESAFIEKPEAGLTLDAFRISDWSTIGTEFLIKTGISITGGSFAYEVHLYDVLGSKQVLGKRYVARVEEPKLLAHTIANDLYEALTGRPGVFFTKIAMVCDKTGKKEVWTMDFDGSNPKQLTSHRSRAIAPAWSADNRKIAYSVYTKNGRNVENIDLYEMDLKTKAARLLSNRKGINSGAAYSPNGSQIALTMSFLGNPEIFTLNPNTREVTRLTKSFGVDVDPSWSPDSKQIAFISTRSGAPMVYRANVEALKSNPNAATRVTFAGSYNSATAWAPYGGKIAFSSQQNGRFDLFLINVDGSNLERLTKDEGINEDPHFSPDGNFIVFTSNRAGQKNIYMITADGQFTRRLTYGLGNCEAPKFSWSTALPL